MNINSCEAAQFWSTVSSANSTTRVQSGCANIAQYLGSVTDRADARFTLRDQCLVSGENAQPIRGDPNVRNTTFVKGQRHLACTQSGQRHDQPVKRADHERDRHPVICTPGGRRQRRG